MHEYIQSAGSRSKNSATNQNRAVFSYGVVRTWYGVCTECGYGVGTERVRSRYEARGFSRGRGVKIALKGPRNIFRGVISLRKNFDFFLPPSSVPAPYFYPVT